MHWNIKENGFEKYFYEIEKEESQTNYKSVYYVPELQKRAEQSLLLLDKTPTPETKLEMADYLAVLKKAVSKEVALVPELPFEYIEDLKPESYTIDVAASLSEYLEKLQIHYSNAFQLVNKKKNARVDYLVKTNEKLYNAKKQAFHNESISNTVLKVFEKNKILQFDDELIYGFRKEDLQKL